MANYILFDTPGSQEFTEAVEQTTGMKWSPICFDGRAHIPRWRRIMNYLIVPLYFVLFHKHINYVIAWQQYFGVSVSLINRIIPLHRGMRITIMTFIYKSRNGFIGKLFHWLVNKAISGKNVDNVIVFSQWEVNYYSSIFPDASSKFKFVTLGIEKCNFPNVKQEDYIFTAGMSNRDYDFLCEALANSKYKLKIACPGVTIPSGADNIRVLSKCYDDDMLRELAGCKLVVIPLKNPNISSGQLMLIQAMQAGKPVIATRISTIEDYIENGKTAILINNTKEELLHAIETLYNDKSLYDSISVNAIKTSMKEYSLKSLGNKTASLAVCL